MFRIIQVYFHFYVWIFCTINFVLLFVFFFVSVFLLYLCIFVWHVPQCYANRHLDWIWIAYLGNQWHWEPMRTRQHWLPVRTNDMANRWELGNNGYLWGPMTWGTHENWATMVTSGTNEMCDQRVGETNGMGDQCNGWCMCDNLEPSEMGNQCCALHDPEVSLSSWMLSLRPCHGVVSTSSTVFGSLWYDIFCRNQ